MNHIKPFTNWASVPIVIDLQIACIILNRSYDNLQKHALKGDFPAFKNGDRKWAVNKEDLFEWMEQQKQPKPQST